MSSSTSEFPPVAKLCSNCQKSQFRDDVPQLFQAGSHLEFEEKYMPPLERFNNWGIIPTEFEFVDWFPELPKLVKSGRDGCDFCYFLYKAITFAASERQSISTFGARIIFVTISYLWGPSQDESLSRGESFCKRSAGLNAMRITLQLSRDKINSEPVFAVDCSIQSLREDSDAISQWLGLDTVAYPSYCDADSICWMNQRLELCQEHDHDVFDETYIPERLIDVSLGTPRLTLRKDVLRSSHSSDFEYAALSYCWGSGENQAKTTATTLYDRQAGISETEMPPVLQDAVRITRALGIPFLWIDALCILQDDQSDWDQQCSEMHNIYGSAKVTLCVANSRSCNEAFLQKTSPCVRLPFQSLRAPDIASSFLVQYICHRSPLYRTWFPGPRFQSYTLIESDVDESRWNGRGWVFQEKILSTRKLIFGRCNLYFQCGYIEHARGNSYPDYDDGPHIGKSLAEKDPNVTYGDWDTHILSDYKRYDASTFSHASDVLPALAGLARLFGNRLNDFYCAGHWRRDLYRSLSWVGGTCRQPVRPPGLMIPSWSRLAKGDTKTYISYGSKFEFDLRSEITVSKARIVTVGDNPFGPLKDCRLWIRGYTLNMGRKELQVSAQPGFTGAWAQWHLIVHGRCFGHLKFDWQTGLDDPSESFPSREDVRNLKLLLLSSFEESISKGVPGSEGSKVSIIHNDQDSEAKEISGDEFESLDYSEESCEKISSQEQTSDQETSTPGDNGSGHRQFRVLIRRGYGLIISPTGNHGEFRRVGVIIPGRGSHKCAPHGDGDLKALQSLAQMETVQLV